MDLQKNIIGLKASATLAINELSQKLITEKLLDIINLFFLEPDW